MMRFAFGVFVGAVGYWAYGQGLLRFPKQDVLDRVMPGASSKIVRPTPQEVSGRPAEPIPS
jgi:hypothetical protein